MGFWDGLSEGWKGANAARAKDAAALGEKLANASHDTGKAIGGMRPLKGAANVTKKGLKAGAITAGVVAGVAALGIMVSRSRKKARDNAKEELRNAELNEPLPSMPQELAGPAPDRMPGEWQNRIAAERGMAPQIGAGAVNPKMNVVPEESVQNLGSSAPTR